MFLLLLLFPLRLQNRLYDIKNKLSALQPLSFFLSMQSHERSHVSWKQNKATNFTPKFHTREYEWLMLCLPQSGNSKSIHQVSVDIAIPVYLKINHIEDGSFTSVTRLCIYYAQIVSVFKENLIKRKLLADAHFSAFIFFFFPFMISNEVSSGSQANNHRR